MNADRLNRRDLFVLAGAAASTGLVPSISWAVVPSIDIGDITDMTMNAPTYATPIGYGRTQDPHDAVDPLALAFGT